MVEIFLMATFLFYFQSEKFGHASKVTTKLAPLISEATGRSLVQNVNFGKYCYCMESQRV